jgi:hypothetical protein
MAGIPANVKKILFPPIGIKATAIVAFVLEILALGCLVVGIVSDAMQKTLWLDTICWFFAAIALFIYGLWWWLSAYFAAKE